MGSAPTDLTAVQEGLTGIQVSWTPPTPLGNTTGYRIYYSGGSSGSSGSGSGSGSGGGSSGSVDVSGGFTDNHLLTGLQNGASYTVFIRGTSGHLSSDRVDYPNIIPLSEFLQILSVNKKCSE